MTTTKAAEQGADQPTQHGIELLMGVDQNCADTVFDTINTNFGSMDNLLKEKL